METKKTKRTSEQLPARRQSGNSAKRRPAGKQPVESSRRKRTEAEPAKRKRPAAKPVSRTAVKRKPAAEKPQLADVVYTPAKAFNRGRFILHLTTIVAVVLALSFGISIFFKVEVITVSGTDKYDAWTVKEVSGIETGDNLLSFGKAKAAGKIKTALPYVQSVRIGIKLPDTVNIEIKELDVVYAIKDASQQWWLITSEGRVVDKADLATAGEYSQVLGVELATPVAGQQAVAQEAAVSMTPTGVTEELPTMAPVVRASDRLTAALEILQYLEDCGIIGEASYINVTDLGNLELKYEQRFIVQLGDTSQLLYKIKCMNAAINGNDENSLKEYDSGVLDISFTIKENQVIYQASEE